MNQFQTPYHLQRPEDFDTEISGTDLKIQYDELAELSQGGPVVGNVRINGQQTEGRFGGPVIIDGKYFYLPMLEKKLFGSYFRLVRIDCKCLRLEKIGELHRMIWIEKIEGDTVYFYDSVDKIKLLSVSLDS